MAAMVMRQRRRPAHYGGIIMFCLLVATTAVSFQPRRMALLLTTPRQRRLLLARTTGMRGGDDGDLAIDSEEEEEEEESSEMDEEEHVENDHDVDPVSTVISSEPVKVFVKTGLNCPLLDQSLELLCARTRNVASLKQSISKQMPGRPPAAGFDLILGTRVLRDVELVDELVEDDEEEEEEEQEEEVTLSLTLDGVPPVDPKFATDPRWRDMSTSDLLDAYAANTAALFHTSQSVFSENENDGWTQSVKLRQQALLVRQQLESSFSPETLQLLQQPTDEQQPAATREHRRGQRRRTIKGGATMNVKRVLQRNLNINWPDTIRNFFLFLFFGYFGGRNSISKHLLILGAPMCFVLQARPIKIVLKQAFYATGKPPGILLSLLPAPQQAIMSLNERWAMKELYGSSSDQEEEEEDLLDIEEEYEQEDIRESDEEYDEYDE